MFKSKKNRKDLITLSKYMLNFKTIDNENHTYNGLNLINEKAITIKPKDYIMKYGIINNKYLQDDYGTYYPIDNVISIDVKKVREIVNVINKSIDKEDWCQKVIYKESEVEIWNDNK